MQLMVGVAGLVMEVKQLKSRPYSKDDQHHESLLSEVSAVLWHFGDVPYTTKQSRGKSFMVFAQSRKFSHRIFH